MIRYPDPHPGAGAPDTYEAVVARLEQIFDEDWRQHRDELAGLVAVLASGDLALRELVTRHCGEGSWPTMAGAPSFDLRKTPRYRLRLNLWYPPASFAEGRQEHANYHSVGQCHNHAFDFFTACVFGPGYDSRFFRLAADDIRLDADEDAALIDEGVLTLQPGEVWYVERDRDFHTQQWPSAYAITLNLVPRPARTESARQYLIDEDALKVLKVVDGRA